VAGIKLGQAITVKHFQRVSIEAEAVEAIYRGSGRSLHEYS